MADFRTLRNKSRLASLGLSEEVVKKINQKIGIAKKLREKFSSIQKNDTIVSTDILFIDAESESVMDYYAKVHEHVSAVPVFVYNQKPGTAPQAPVFEKFPKARTLRTPITLGRLSDVLFDVISPKKTISTPETESHDHDEVVSHDHDEVVSSEKVDSHPEQEELHVINNSFKILVVDDSFPVRKYLEQKLPELIADIDNTINFDIQFANSGKSSVEKVKEARGDFDMVFLDIMMEDVNGYQVCKWIKKVKKSINVVMLTSKSSTIDRVRANLSGCDNYISKPPKDSALKKVLLMHDKFQNAQKVKSA